MRRRFGEIDFESAVFDFSQTDYYRKEFGPGLLRQFISFKKLIPAERLSKIKNLTNKIERKLSNSGRRTVNIDPGYICLSKLVLASTKDYKHRIYLGGGIYAEITLIYQGKIFVPWECTYPDYRSPEYIEVFNRIREEYASEIKSCGRGE